MRPWAIFAFSIALACLMAATASATTVTTMSSNFESPVFTVGDVGGNPQYSPGQGGWGGYNATVVGSQVVYASISDQQAYSGTQSLLTVDDSRTLVKALDTSTGEYPSAGPFELGPGSDWWVQARLFINPGGSAVMTLANGLGGCPLLSISTGGVPYANSCLGQDTGQSTLGAGAFGQWLLVEMVHTVSMGQGLEYHIKGNGIDRSITLGQYSGPGTGNPVYLGLTGNAYWDDVRAGTGEVPVSVVPVPATAWLLISALGVLGGRARRLSGRGPTALPFLRG